MPYEVGQPPIRGFAINNIPGFWLNRAADALRLCAQSLTYSKSALGAKYRRLKARLGAPKAIVAMAHHLARLVYRMLRYGQNYVEQGIHQYELKFQLQRIKWLNLQLVPA
jgi:transposase